MCNLHTDCNKIRLVYLLYCYTQTAAVRVTTPEAGCAVMLGKLCNFCVLPCVMFSVYRSNLLRSAIFVLAFLLWACDTDCSCFCIVISFLLETVRAKHCFARSLCCLDSWLTICPKTKCLQCIIIVNNAISFITYVYNCCKCIFFFLAYCVTALCFHFFEHLARHDETSVLHAFLNGELCHLCSGVSSVPLPMCLYVTSLAPWEIVLCGKCVDPVLMCAYQYHWKLQRLWLEGMQMRKV